MKKKLIVIVAIICLNQMNFAQNAIKRDGLITLGQRRAKMSSFGHTFIGIIIIIAMVALLSFIFDEMGDGE